MPKDLPVSLTRSLEKICRESLYNFNLQNFMMQKTTLYFDLFGEIESITYIIFLFPVECS